MCFFATIEPKPKTSEVKKKQWSEAHSSPLNRNLVCPMSIAFDTGSSCAQWSIELVASLHEKGRFLGPLPESEEHRVALVAWAKREISKGVKFTAGYLELTTTEDDNIDF
jgi:hypothetical protein